MNDILINMLLVLGAFIGLGMMAEGRPFGEWTKFTIGGMLLGACVTGLFI